MRGGGGAYPARLRGLSEQQDRSASVSDLPPSAVTHRHRTNSEGFPRCSLPTPSVHRHGCFHRCFTFTQAQRTPPPKPTRRPASSQGQRARVTIRTVARLSPRAGSLELHVPRPPLRHSWTERQPNTKSHLNQVAQQSPFLPTWSLDVLLSLFLMGCC